MKKLVMLIVMLAVCGNVFASGWRAKYAPSVDPVTVQSQWDGLAQITPYCDSTVGKLTNVSQITEPAKYQQWADCYNCKREAWAKKWNLTSEASIYGALCPN